MLYGDRSVMAHQQGTAQGHMARDLEYLQGLYPGQMKTLQEYVITACDRLDYESSPMYDEFPDRLMVHQVCDSVCRQIEEDEILREEELYGQERQDAGAAKPGFMVKDGYPVEAPSELLSKALDGSMAEAMAEFSSESSSEFSPEFLPEFSSEPQVGEMILPRAYETGELNGQELEWVRYQQMNNRPPKGPPPWGPPPGPPPWGPPPGPPPRPHPPWISPPPRRPGGWLNDVINVLLLNEMHRRRCRSGRCF